MDFYCKYRLPCGYCEKFEKHCDHYITKTIAVSDSNLGVVFTSETCTKDDTEYINHID